LDGVAQFMTTALGELHLQSCDLGVSNLNPATALILLIASTYGELGATRVHTSARPAPNARLGQESHGLTKLENSFDAAFNASD